MVRSIHQVRKPGASRHHQLRCSFVFSWTWDTDSWLAETRRLRDQAKATMSGEFRQKVGTH